MITDESRVACPRAENLNIVEVDLRKKSPAPFRAGVMLFGVENGITGSSRQKKSPPYDKVG